MFYKTKNSCLCLELHFCFIFQKKEGNRAKKNGEKREIFLAPSYSTLMSVTVTYTYIIQFLLLSKPCANEISYKMNVKKP